MKQIGIVFIISISILTVVTIQSCKHEPLYKVDKISIPITPTGIDTNKIAGLDGVKLYTDNCATCHGQLASSSKLGATVAQIQSGILTKTEMHVFSILTISQLQSISDALNITTSPIVIKDGATLYANNCLSCHGVLPASVKLGASVSRIKTAISTVNEMKSISSLQTLSSAQIDSISSVLISTPMPTDGASLYVINCARCHSALPNSSVQGSSSSRIQQAIREKREMNYLSTLTITQIQAISSVLISSGQGGD